MVMIGVVRGEPEGERECDEWGMAKRWWDSDEGEIERESETKRLVVGG